SSDVCSSDLPEPLARAYAACEALARSHYENFPVASRLLPAPLRPHIAAIYAFARIADDFADEPGMEADQRLRLLADWRAQLHSPATEGVFLAVQDTVSRFDLPVQLL